MSEVIHLRQGWLVRWADKTGRERTTRVLSETAEAHIAAFAVRIKAEQADLWGEFLGEPRRVRQ